MKPIPCIGGVHHGKWTESPPDGYQAADVQVTPTLRQPCFLTIENPHPNPAPIIRELSGRVFLLQHRARYITPEGFPPPTSGDDLLVISDIWEDLGHTDKAEWARSVAKDFQ